MLSLIVPVRNWPADRIGACVRSFLRLKSTSLDEIIVVDFGSSQPVELPSADERVRVVRVNAGRWNPAEAANIGVAASRNAVVAKVDADILIAAENGPLLDAAADSCGRDEGMIAVRTTDLPEGVDAETAFASTTAELIRAGRPRARSGCGGLGIFPVELWNEIGGFDPHCRREADADFADRVRRSGHKFRWAPPDRFRTFHIWHSPARTAGDIDDARPENRPEPRQDGSILRSIAFPPAEADRIQAPNIVSRPRPLVSVAIASWPGDGRDWTLAGAIRGFAGQIDNDFEVLIANGGPTDEISAGLSRLTGPRGEALAVRVVDVGKASVAAARNRLTDEARGRYICVADDDAIPLPRRLSDHLRCFEKESGIHGSHGGWIDVDHLNRTVNFSTGGNRTLDALLSNADAVTAEGVSLYRSDVMRAIRYDEAVVAGPDHDLALRMANMGCRIPYTGSYVTVRRSRGDTVGRSFADQQAIQQEGRRLIRETLGDLDERRLDEQATLPVACGNQPTSEQLTDLIVKCSGLVRNSGGPTAFAVARQPKARPLVSIVIPCFNYGRFVGEAVASAKAQTFENIEVIVVDGGSTDGETRRIVAGLEGEVVRVFLRKGRHRAGSNRNYGVRRARGKYVCCLDADDKLAPTYVEKAVFLMEHYGYDVVSAAVQKLDQETTRYGVAEKVDLQVLLDRNQMATCGVFRKTLWKAAGGYRDHGDGSPATHVHEDWEFWVRLAAQGARFFNIERDHLFLYRIHNTPSVSRRDGVMPLDWQRRRIRELNADLIGDEAIERSIALRYRTLRAREPLINLAPSGELPEPKSIVVALPWMVLGGAERLLSRIMKRLAQDAWDISILTTLAPNPPDGDSEAWFAAATDRIYHLPKFLAEERWSDFLDYLIVSRRARRLLIAGSAYAYEQLPDLKTKHPQLKVFDLLFNTAGHTRNNRQFAEYIDGNIVENSEVREWLLNRGEKDQRIVTIPSGVDLSAPAARRDRSLRESIGAQADDLVVGFCGRWSAEKNPIGFIEIAERLAENRQVHFVMTGAGQLAADVSRRVAATASLAGRFHLLGNVPSIEPVLASLDILVLPSLVDGRPVAVLEALAAGVPVIASRVGGVPELVLPGKNGELCPPGDTEAFVNAIIALAADRKRLARYKTGARAFAEEHLDERLMLQCYLDVLATGDCGQIGTPWPGTSGRRRTDRRPDKLASRRRSSRSSSAFVHSERFLP